MSKSFTSDKLDWLNAIMADNLLNPTARNVGYWIAQHINERTGKAMLSDKTLSDKINVQERAIRRARNELKKRHWINWTRTQTANIYVLGSAPINRVSDLQIMLREQRAELRNQRKSRVSDRSKKTYLKPPERSLATGQSGSNGPDRSAPNDHHTPIDYTLGLTPKERMQPSKDTQLLRKDVWLHIGGTTGTC